MIWKRNKFTISGNYEYDVTNSVKLVPKVSYFLSNPELSK